MRFLSFLLPLLFACSAFGAGTERISLVIQITNVPVTSNTLTINATTRTWTNLSSSSYILTNLAGVGPATTNLANNLASFPLSGPLSFAWISTNSFRLTANIGNALAASQVGSWAVLTLSTQTAEFTYTALWPLENIQAETNRTNQASAFVSGLTAFSTQAFATNATAVSNLLHKGAGAVQKVKTEVIFDNTLRASNGVAFTNGFTSALTNINPVFTNANNFGNAFRSEGSGGNSLQIGSNAISSGVFSMAIGNSSVAFSNSSIALGKGATSTNDQAIAIGVDARSAGSSGLAVGDNSVAGTNSVAFGSASSALAGGVALGFNAASISLLGTALGNNSSVGHNNSTALGQSATTTDTNQIRLGTSSDFVSIPGVLAISGTQTNTTFRGTNVVDARVDFTSRGVTSLANGNNSGVVLGTNTYVRMSGPTAAYTINGMVAEQDGSFHIVEFTNAVNSVTIANQSGTDPTAANRIITGTGGDVTFTNNPVVLMFIYNAAHSRWKIANWFR